MPCYEITQTQLELLKNDIRHGKILGVGMLSNFIKIYIQNWKNRQVKIASMYFPDDDYCVFDFSKNRAIINDPRKGNKAFKIKK